MSVKATLVLLLLVQSIVTAAAESSECWDQPAFIVKSKHATESTANSSSQANNTDERQRTEKEGLLLKELLAAKRYAGSSNNLAAAEHFGNAYRFCEGHPEWFALVDTDYFRWQLENYGIEFAKASIQNFRRNRDCSQSYVAIKEYLNKKIDFINQASRDAETYSRETELKALESSYSNLLIEIDRLTKTTSTPNAETTPNLSWLEQY